MFLSWLILLTGTSFSQQLKPGMTGNKSRTARCNTMEELENYFRLHPEARETAARNKNRYAPENLGTQRIQGIITIPVVVHIVGSAARQAQVTDADIAWQIAKMNEDYAGTNADSTNAVDFYGIRGHSSIRFCLASQDPYGNPTNGIVRVVSSLSGSQVCGSIGLAKHNASCGSDAWNPNQYFNIWVAEAGNCLLGIAQFPGTGDPSEDGILVSYEGFSNNPAYASPGYDLGRTAVHETGHYLGLYHIWGDESGCSQEDFRQLPGSCLLPASLISPNDDTPRQAGETTNCPTGTRTDACTVTAPGINYQNFMDYTLDPCYSMFTIKQVERMEWVLVNCRQGLVSSNGCFSITPFALDATLSIVSPGPGRCTISGTSATVCAGSALSPVIEIKNVGTGLITSLTIVSRLGTGSPSTFNWNGSLFSLGTELISLPALTMPSAPGSYPLEIYVTGPNGMTDQKLANDTAVIDISVVTAQTLPITENFTNSVFPSPGWKVINPDNSISWVRAEFSGAYSPPACAGINIYDYDAIGQKDILVTPPVDLGQAMDSVRVSFMVSHAGYDNTFGPDSLELVYSTDCGNSWINFGGYKKWTNAPLAGNNLSTNVNTTDRYFPTGISEWKKESVTMAKSAFAGNPSSILIGWRVTTGFGNNLFIDDISIDPVSIPAVDAAVTSISQPSKRECKNKATPQITIRNFGSQAITSLKIYYQVDGGPVSSSDWTGNLGSGSSFIFSPGELSIGTAGNHTFSAFIGQPNGLVSDGNTANDTLHKNYTVYTIATLSSAVKETFSGTFPPAGWEVDNPDNDLPWQKNSTAGNAGTGSAWYNAWNNPSISGRWDDLLLPNLGYAGIDSIFLTFDLAAVYQDIIQGSPEDTLSVLLSRDCGNTFTTVYQKWGYQLETNVSGTSANAEFYPGLSEWRKDSLNLGMWLGSSESLFQLAFRVSGRYQNNLFLDNINLYTKTLPQKLKSSGILILPNPFHDVFYVWHYLTPVSLRYIRVFNAAGQLVWSNRYNGNAQKLIPIDLSGKSPGVYIVTIGYVDKSIHIQQKIIKN